MSLIELTRQKQRLDDLFEKARAFPDAELQSHWCRYLCVLVSGFLENSVKLTYSEYARRRSDPWVADFVQSRLQQFQNPKMGAILEIVGAFSQEWRESLDDKTNDRIGESVNSIVGNRHKIAHGESVGLTLRSLSQYYADALKVVEFMQEQCGL